MALQTGISAGKILVIAGAGYTGTVLLKNGKLSEVIGELQSFVKGLERSGERSDGDSDLSDAVAQQVRRLAMEVRQLASARQITVVGGGGSGLVNLSGLIVPAATVGALGYGYMWWKGLKFTDLMYVTKKSMATAVANLNKHLEQVTNALTAAKEHLTQRIQHLDDKMETQKEISKQIQFDINCATENLTQIDGDLKELQDLVTSLDTKVVSLEEKQNLGNMGVIYLCNFVQSGGKKAKMPKALEDQMKSSGRNFSSLTYNEAGLKQLTDDVDRAISEPRDAFQDGPDIVEDLPRPPQPRPLLRMRSAVC